MQVGDLVRQKYPVHRQTIGLVLETSGKHVLVSWPDWNGYGRDRRRLWHNRGHLWRVS